MSETAATEQRWWPTWYVTRLHLVPDGESSFAIGRALCGATVYDPERGLSRTSDWQRRRMDKGVQRCANCVRRAPKPEPEPAPSPDR